MISNFKIVPETGTTKKEEKKKMSEAFLEAAGKIDSGEQYVKEVQEYIDPANEKSNDSSTFISKNACKK